MQPDSEELRLLCPTSSRSRASLDHEWHPWLVQTPCQEPAKPRLGRILPSIVAVVALGLAVLLAAPGVCKYWRYGHSESLVGERSQNSEVSTEQFCGSDSYLHIKVNTSTQKLECTCDCFWSASEGACHTYSNSCCWSCCCLVWRPQFVNNEKRALPSPAPAASSRVAIPDMSRKMPPVIEGCLCIFDVDRTLTAAQDALCPGNFVLEDVADSAYLGGPLSLSKTLVHLSDTFCRECFLGAVSDGRVASEEKAQELARRLQGINEGPFSWSAADNVTSPLLAECGSSSKAPCAKAIVNWYESKGVKIPTESVYIFDDDATHMAAGISSFGYNFHQVSCASRDTINANMTGRCGATLEEITRTHGSRQCP